MGRDINRIRLGVSVDRKLGQRLEEMAKDTRITKSKLVDEALEYLMQAHNVEIEDYKYTFKFGHTE